MEILFWFKHSSKVIYLAFNKVLLLVMFNGSPRNDTMVFLIPGSSTMNSSLKLFWISDSDIAVPKLLELSNCCSVINTQSRWENFILRSLLFFYKKKIWWRFRGLLIHSLVTPNCKNMEKSPLNFGEQPLKIEIGQKFYLSGQTWYLITSVNKISSVSNCCELKRDIFFFELRILHPFRCYIVWLHSERPV